MSAARRPWAIDVLARRGGYRVAKRAVAALVRNLLDELERQELLPVSARELSVLFTTDEEIRVLNGQYRGKDKATDVLSFSQQEGEDDPDAGLGDIVISLDTAAVQAKRFRVTRDQEILRLLIHGVLHLSGFDHVKVPQAEARRMRRLEQRLYAAFAERAEGLTVKGGKG